MSAAEPVAAAPAAAFAPDGLRRVLMITPHFPPDSSAAAHRVRILAPHLPAAGWEPTVLTLRPDAYESRLDPSLAGLVPDTLRVIRVPAWPARVTRRIGLGDLGIRSFRSLHRAASSLLVHERFDALFITIYPTYTALLGPGLKRRFGVPFVLDYQDPWVGEWGRSVGGGANGRPDLKSRTSRAMATRLEPIAVRAADALTAVSRATFEGPLSRVGTPPPAVCAEIPLGGDPCDISYLRAHPRPNAFFDRRDGAVHVCSVGTILPRATQTVRALLAAARTIEGRLGVPLRLHFFGTSNQWGTQPVRVVPLAQEAGIEGLVHEEPGRLDYLDALQMLADAHVNLVLGSDEPHYTASRLFPALMAGRPVLAAVHRASTVVPWIEQSGASAHVVSFDERRPVDASVLDIADALLAACQTSLRQPAASMAASAPPWSGACLAGEMARVFDAVAKTRAQGSGPGAQGSGLRR